MRIESGVVEGSRNEPEWPHFNRQAATQLIKVAFEPRFEATPSVVVGLAKFDMEQLGHKLLAVRTDDITPEGFTLAIESGHRTQLESVGVFWIAYER